MHHQPGCLAITQSLAVQRLATAPRVVIDILASRITTTTVLNIY
jgi:hypothetical protein